MLGLVYAHHKFGHEFVGAPAPSISYVLCTLPRSGSSLLADVLASTELAGSPTEYFDRNQFEAFSRDWKVSGLADYLAAMLRKKTSLNGVFGLKAHFHQLGDVLGDRDIADVLPDPRFVLLVRLDHVRQAVSWMRAIQTEQWTSTHAAVRGSPRFDADHIGELIVRIEREERLWAEFFEQRGAVPLRVAYEEMVESLDETVVAVLEAVGVELPADFSVPAPTLERQADGLSDEWVRRYRALAGGAVAHSTSRTAID